MTFKYPILIGDPPGVDYLYKKKLSEKQITKLVNRISDHFHHPRLQIVFRYNHTRRRHGYAFTNENKLSFNYPIGFNIGSVVHEMAHIIECNGHHNIAFKSTYYKILLIL